MKTTFVCCVESGWLETQTIRLVESLRQFGGTFSQEPVIAVTPRFGPPLSRRTQVRFRQLGVIHLRSSLKSRYTWFKFLNKPLALLAAEDHVQTDAVCWLDSDLLFLNNPHELWMKPGEDFVGFPVEDKEMGTTGAHDDPYEPIWRAFCRHLDIDIDELPWVTTAETGERVRFYLNGGIFAYRKASGFARTYHDICLALLDSNIGTDERNYNIGLKEMSAIGFAIVKLGLKWRALPYSHDYVVSSYTHEKWYREEMLKQAVIVHYHDAMWPHFWATFLKCMQSTHPTVAAWLEQAGPMKNEAAPHWKFASKILNRQRLAAEASYRKLCSVKIPLAEK